MLIGIARDLRRNAYAPYSGFTVGAACRAASGVTYFGCNVENSSYPVGICAERVAVAAAIAHGEKRIAVLALAGGREGAEPDGAITPCGMCLQFLAEFMEPEGRILVADGIDGRQEYTLADLLPRAFNMQGPETDDER